MESDKTLWVDDQYAARCRGCDLKFTFVRRRHHCRQCGQVFCSDCLIAPALSLTRNPLIDAFSALVSTQRSAGSKVCAQCDTILRQRATTRRDTGPHHTPASQAAPSMKPFGLAPEPLPGVKDPPDAARSTAMGPSSPSKPVSIPLKREPPDHAPATASSVTQVYLASTGQVVRAVRSPFSVFPEAGSYSRETMWHSNGGLTSLSGSVRRTTFIGNPVNDESLNHSATLCSGSATMVLGSCEWDSVDPGLNESLSPNGASLARRDSDRKFTELPRHSISSDSALALAQTVILQPPASRLPTHSESEKEKLISYAIAEVPVFETNRMTNWLAKKVSDARKCTVFLPRLSPMAPQLEFVAKPCATLRTDDDRVDAGVFPTCFVRVGERPPARRLRFLEAFERRCSMHLIRRVQHLFAASRDRALDGVGASRRGWMETRPRTPGDGAGERGLVTGNSTGDVDGESGAAEAPKEPGETRIDDVLWTSAVCDLSWRLVSQTMVGLGGHISDHVDVLNIAGATVADTEVVPGVAFFQTIASKRMRTFVDSPKVLLLGGSVGYHVKPQSDLLEYMEAYRGYLEKLYQRVRFWKPTVVVVEGGMHHFLQERILQDTSITLILNAGLRTLNILQRCCGARIISDLQYVGSSELSSSPLGSCSVFELRDVADRSISVFRGLVRPVYTTVLLRGGDVEQLRVVRRVLERGISAAYHLALQAHYLDDFNATIVVEDSPEESMPNRAQREFLTLGATEGALEDSVTRSRQPDLSAECMEVITRSPWSWADAKAVENQASRAPGGVFDPEGGTLAEKAEGVWRDDGAAEAGGGPASGSAAITPNLAVSFPPCVYDIDKAHVEFVADSIVVNSIFLEHLDVSLAEESAVAAASSTLSHQVRQQREVLPFYDEGDATLFEFLHQRAKEGDSLRLFVHDHKRITVKTKTDFSNSNQRPRGAVDAAAAVASQLFRLHQLDSSFSYKQPPECYLTCKRCTNMSTVCTAVVCSPHTLNLSLGAFLEAAVYSSGDCRAPCGHNLHLDMVRYFVLFPHSVSEVSVSFDVEHLTTFTLETPSLFLPPVPDEMVARQRLHLQRRKAMKGGGLLQRGVMSDSFANDSASRDADTDGDGCGSSSVASLALERDGGRSAGSTATSHRSRESVFSGTPIAPASPLGRWVTSHEGSGITSPSDPCVDNYVDGIIFRQGSIRCRGRDSSLSGGGDEVSGDLGALDRGGANGAPGRSGAGAVGADVDAAVYDDGDESLPVELYFADELAELQSELEALRTAITHGTQDPLGAAAARDVKAGGGSAPSEGPSPAHFGVGGAMSPTTGAHGTHSAGVAAAGGAPGAGPAGAEMFHYFFDADGEVKKMQRKGDEAVAYLEGAQSIEDITRIRLHVIQPLVEEFLEWQAVQVGAVERRTGRRVGASTGAGGRLQDPHWAYSFNDKIALRLNEPTSMIAVALRATQRPAVGSHPPLPEMDIAARIGSATNSSTDGHSAANSMRHRQVADDICGRRRDEEEGGEEVDDDDDGAASSAGASAAGGGGDDGEDSRSVDSAARLGRGRRWPLEGGGEGLPAAACSSAPRPPGGPPAADEPGRTMEMVLGVGPLTGTELRRSPTFQCDQEAIDALSGRDATVPAKATYQHILSDLLVDADAGARTTVVVEVMFPRQFGALQYLYSRGEPAHVVESLQRCRQFQPQGGKTKSDFFITGDERFILKQIKPAELRHFFEFGSSYFAHIAQMYGTALGELRQREREGGGEAAGPRGERLLPTSVLGKIFGVYSVQIKKRRRFPETAPDIRHYMLMENLRYGRRVDATFDLKGSQRNRTAAEGASVLLDQDLVNFLRKGQFFYCTSEEKSWIIDCLSSDAHLLAASYIMDYSLMVSLDHARGVLFMGMIDYLHPYSGAKVIESKVKAGIDTVLGHAGRDPTIIDPNNYRARFVKWMNGYFCGVPDKMFAVRRKQAREQRRRRLGGGPLG